MQRNTEFYKELENQDKVYEKTSVTFTAANPETKTLQLSPASGKTWYIDTIRAWTNEVGVYGGDDVGSRVNLDVYINGTSKKIAKRYVSEMIGATYRNCGIAIDCKQRFGQRLKITETTNGVYISAVKTYTGTPKLYLEVEGTEI